MTNYELGVWLGDIRVATIREQRTGAIRLQYSDDAKSSWSFGEPVLSVALPLTPDGRYPPGKTMPWLEGLLPEGDARATIERTFGVRRGDTFGLLRAVGRDCAGAVVFEPNDDSPAPQRVNAIAPLSSAEVVEAIRSLGSYPLGANREVRVSLAGLQDKLLLTRTRDGAWARPMGGTPSTHILKPQDERYEAMVANEAFCLRLARRLQLTTIEVEELDADDRPVLVVARYDRRERSDGTIERIHQEDFCQALSMPALQDSKYEESGGPSLRQVAEVLDRWTDGLPQVDGLVRVMAFNVVIGNADAHAKNLSLLHDPVAGIRLAPLYDVMSTIHYPTVMTKAGPAPVSTKLAMRVNSVDDIHAVTSQDLAGEAASWHVNRDRAATLVAALLDEMDEAAAEAAAETPTVPEQLVSRISARVEALRSGASAGRDQ